MLVKELKEKLQNIINTLEEYNDTDEVKKVSNTYFLNGARLFLGIAGYDGGYIDLDDIQIEDQDEEE